jgi:hypothetical protein
LLAAVALHFYLPFVLFPFLLFLLFC